MDSRLRDPGLSCLPPEAMTQHAVIQPLKAEPLSLFARRRVWANSTVGKRGQDTFRDSWVRARIDPDGSLPAAERVISWRYSIGGSSCVGKAEPRLFSCDV